MPCSKCEYDGSARLHLYEGDQFCNECLPIRDTIFRMADTLERFAEVLRTVQGKDRDIWEVAADRLEAAAQGIRPIVRENEFDEGRYEELPTMKAFYILDMTDNSTHGWFNERVDAVVKAKRHHCRCQVINSLTARVVYDTHESED